VENLYFVQDGDCMENYKNDRIGSCERGENPTLMVKMKSGFAVKSRPSYFYPKELRYNEKYEYNEQNYGNLKQKITETLKDLMKKTYGGA
jgi:hypothetical protein